MSLRQHNPGWPGQEPCPQPEPIDHFAENARRQRGFKSSQLRGHWIRLQRAVTAWANRRDELRPHEKEMYEAARKELDKVEAEIEALRLEDEAEAAPEEG